MEKIQFGLFDTFLRSFVGFFVAIIITVLIEVDFVFPANDYVEIVVFVVTESLGDIFEGYLEQWWDHFCGHIN